MQDSQHNGLEIRLFGPMSVHLQGKPLPPPRVRKEWWLLAFLTLRAGREVERSFLAETLWPDSTEQNALYNLRRALSELRHALGSEEGRFQSPSPSMLSFDLQGAFLDVREFDVAIAQGDPASLEAAVALYQGSLLEGCMEGWVFQERLLREQAYQNALETLGERAMQQKQYAEAVRYLRLLLHTDALRETALRLLMQALAENGEYSAATAAYQDFRRMLMREMRVEPSPETVALYQRLRAETLPRPPSRASTPPSPASPTSPAAPPVPAALLRVPHPLTDLIGREMELAEIESILTSSRLITLMGTGGVGKTRLAIAAAREVANLFPEGVWFVDLSALSDSALVPQTVVKTLEIREETGRSALQSLQEALRTRRLLLILDNCEHLHAACVLLVNDLLQHCPELHILATSRQALGITGERLLPVPSLALPARDLAPNSEAELPALLQEATALRLFVERAIQAYPLFRLKPESVSLALQICRHLDGIPLALELAAARMRGLSLEQIATRLEDRFRLLKGGLDRPGRHQTLQAALDWSYDLLSETERVLLCRLVVFAGGWTLESAETVCADAGEREKGRVGKREEGKGKSGDEESVGQESGLDEAEILDVLTALMDKSLVVYDEHTGAARYRMLETVRQYAEVRLNASGSEAAVRKRHLAWCLAIAETSASLGVGANQPTVLARLEQEHDNFRAALAWCQASDSEGILYLRLAAGLWWFWYMHGYYREGRSQMETALSHTEALDCPTERAVVLNGIGNLAVVQGDTEAARRCFEACLTIRQETGDRSGMGSVFGNLGILACACLDYSEAQDWYEKALAVAQEFGDTNKICAALNGLARVAAKQLEFERARTLFEEVLVLATEQNNAAGIMITLINLASVAEDQADYPRSRSLFAQALEKAHILGDRRSSATLIEALARMALRLEPEHISKAATLVAAAQTLREQIGVPVPPEQCKQHEEVMAQLQERMGTEAFEAAFAMGRSLEMEPAVKMALETPPV